MDRVCELAEETVKQWYNGAIFTCPDEPADKQIAIAKLALATIFDCDVDDEAARAFAYEWLLAVEEY